MAKTHAERVKEMAEKLASQGFEVVKSTSGTLYTVRPSDRGQRLELHNRRAATHDARYFLMERNHDANADLLSDALGYMAFQANDSAGQEFSIRVAERDGGATHYLDLCNDKGQVVKVTGGGWEVITSTPVRFVRPDGATDLPEPQRGGSVDLLRELLPLDDPQQWHLALGWVFGAFREKGAHYAAVLQGSKGGTAKTTIAEMMASVVDPYGDEQLVDMNPIRESILLHAHSRWVAGWDEVKPLTTDKVTALKAMATGTTYSARMKYSDGDVFTCRVCRPIILTGHSNLLDDEPFLSRSIPLWRPTPVPPEREMSPTEAKARLRNCLPLILGAILDAIAAGLRVATPDYPKERQPRMSDAFGWIGRCFQGLGLKPVHFLDALDAAQRVACEQEVEDWPVLAPLQELADVGFSGTPEGLYARLNEHPARGRGSSKWPGNAAALTKQINERQTFLEDRGIIVEPSRTGKQRGVRVWRRNPNQEGGTSPPASQLKLPADTQRGLEAADKMPNALVVMEYTDGGCVLFGGCAQQAAQRLNRSADENGLLRLSKQEWDSVSGELKHEGYYFV